MKLVNENEMKTSKSILIIDTPSSCENCPLCVLFDKDRCTAADRRWCGDEAGYFSSKIKPSWCPLKKG